ncbi:hypothetical protein [Rubritalea marina]|uniref:hypothetical protein n=1 Tax=Rubritalea marina TaxID=361055 RepID=UPI0003A95DA5|nr:hypothetical protein [Rubritalea marina]
MNVLGSEPEVHVQPSSSKIVRKEEQDGSVVWLMPAKKMPNALLLFGLVWSGFVGFMLLMMLGGESVAIPMLLFMIPFVAVGVGMLYFGIRKMLMESLLVVHASEVCLIQKVFGKVKQKTLKRGSKIYVERYVAYSQNEQPVYGLHLHTPNGEELKFGSRLSRDEVGWMLTQLREELSEPVDAQAPQASAPGYAGAALLEDQAPLEEIEHKALTLKALPSGGFQLMVKNKLGLMFLLIGLTFTMIMSLFVFADSLGIENADPVPAFLAVIFYMVGIGLMIVGWGRLGRIKYVEFTDYAVKIHHTKFGNARGYQEYSKSDFDQCQMSHSGSVNNQPRYQVSLLGEHHKVKLLHFETIQHASQVEAWVQQWLG